VKRTTIVVGALLGLAIGAGVVAALTYPTPTQSPTLQSNTEVAVTLSGSHDLSPTPTPFPADDTLRFVTADGNVTVSGQQQANLTITQITGTETRVEDLNVSGAPVTIDPEDKPAVTVAGETETLAFRAMALDDGTVDFEYSGASGETDLTVRGLPADTAVAARDASGALDKTTTNGDGNATFTLPNSAHDVELVSTDLSDPVISDPDPTGTQSLTPSQLAVNVTDPDFPADSVDVNISLDGSQVHTETITSETRVTTGIGSLTPGTHTWTVEATDSDGNVELDTFTFGVPSNITVYNESSPQQLIDATEINATVYSDGEAVFSRTTTNGTIPMEGLPSTEDLVVELQAKNYTTRTAIVEDLAMQQRYYLLPTDATSVEVRFELSDPTGEFPSSESQLFVKRPLNVSGNTTYQLVTAGTFGAAGFTTTLERDVRYRLVLKNRDNDVRVLGAYEAVTSETVTLRPDTLELNFSERGGYDWEYSYANETGNPSVSFQFSDPDNETRNLVVTIFEKGNPANTLSGYPVTYPGPLGTVMIDEPLTGDQANETWVVEWEADRNQDAIDSSQRASASPTVFRTLPPWVGVWAGMGVVLMTGGLFSRANVAVGAVVTSLAAEKADPPEDTGGVASGVTIVIGLLIAVFNWASQQGGL